MTRKEKEQLPERGQAIALIAVAFVVLLGFTALAVDGGMLYSDRRYAQNAADASSLSGGGKAAITLENSAINLANWSCGGSLSNVMTQARNKAIARAADNDFTIDTNPDNDGVSDDGHVRFNCTADYLDVIVEVTIETKTAFAHFVYPGPLRNTVDAVTRIYPRKSVADGRAIVSLNPQACSGQSSGLGFHGTTGVTVVNSGVYSNGCLRGDGLGPNGQVEADPNHAIGYAEEWYHSTGDFSPPPTQDINRMTVENIGIQLPGCDPATATIWTRSDFEDLANSPDPDLAPGLHCVYADNQSVVNLNNGSLVGSGVTIVLWDVELLLGGNVFVELSAPPQGTNPFPAVAGLLFYAHDSTRDSNCNPSGNLNDLQLNGGTGSTFTGTVYGPCYDIAALGNSDTVAYSSQIIGWNVEFGGTADGLIVFDPSLTATKPTSLDLYE